MVVEVGVDEGQALQHSHNILCGPLIISIWYLYTKFHGNPSNTSQDIWLQNSNVKFLMVTEEKSEVHQSY